jgi:adenylylsulfate kinase-like enzyme
MNAREDAVAVAIIGPYGSGKSTLTAQIADLLESRDVRYAAIDLDWLGWYHDQRVHDHADSTMMLRNLTSVVDNYRSVGVDHFVVALSLASQADVQRLAGAMGMPIRTVELTVPIDVIERRLVGDPTTGRRQDLVEARRQVAESVGTGFSDLVVDNDRDVLNVADEIISWLQWTA